MPKTKEYGKCFRCKRVFRMLSFTFPLVQVEYFEGHLRAGVYHHKSICVACEAKADELTESMKPGGKKKWKERTS